MKPRNIYVYVCMYMCVYVYVCVYVCVNLCVMNNIYALCFFSVPF